MKNYLANRAPRIHALIHNRAAILAHTNAIVLSFCAFVAVSALTSSCESLDYDLPEDTEAATANDGKTKVTLHVSRFEQITFESFATKAASSVADVCSFLDMAVFDASGKKVATGAQKAADGNFGTMQLSLAPGEYKLVMVASNGKGKATVTSPEEVTFKDNKLGDTFFICRTLTVGDSDTYIDLTLNRCVAMIRFVFTDETLPDNFAQLQFYYIGGSSTLNPTTGFGAKASKQTETREVGTAERDAAGHLVMDIYTIPHETDDILTTLRLTAKDAEGNDIQIIDCDYTPFRLNTVTRCVGSLFAASTNEQELVVKINADWGTPIELTF